MICEYHKLPRFYSKIVYLHWSNSNQILSEKATVSIDTFCIILITRPWHKNWRNAYIYFTGSILSDLTYKRPPDGPLDLRHTPSLGRFNNRRRTRQ